MATHAGEQASHQTLPTVHSCAAAEREIVDLKRQLEASRLAAQQREARPRSPPQPSPFSRFMAERSCVRVQGAAESPQGSLSASQTLAHSQIVSQSPAPPRAAPGVSLANLASSNQERGRWRPRAEPPPPPRPVVPLSRQQRACGREHAPAGVVVGRRRSPAAFR